MSAAPKRRWFQFGLRTMFVALTLFAVWLGWELKCIRERRAFIDWLRTSSVNGFTRGEVIENAAFNEPQRIPVWRQWLGDKSFQMVVLHDVTVEDGRTALRLFPEARIGTYNVPTLSPEALLEYLSRPAGADSPELEPFGSSR
jgi:hypothetical protein